MDPVVALHLLHGAGSGAQLRELGVDRGAVLRALRSGRIHGIGRSRYALPTVSTAHAAAVTHGGLLTCVSALHAAGVLVKPDDAIHAWARPDRRVCGPMRWHRSDRFRAQDVGDVGSALELASACLPEIDQLIALDSALNQHLVDQEWTPRCGSAERREWRARMADGRSQSAGETLARVALVLAGFGVEPQRHFEGVGRVDLLVEAEVVVEIDGRSYHEDPRAFRRDRERDRILNARGIPVLRYAFSEVYAREWDPALDVAAVLAARGDRRAVDRHPASSHWDSLRRASRWSDLS